MRGDVRRREGCDYCVSVHASEAAGWLVWCSCRTWPAGQ